MMAGIKAHLVFVSVLLELGAHEISPVLGKSIKGVSLAVQDSKCSNAGGICQSISYSCGGSYLTNYCPSSGASIKCCVPRQDSKCTSAHGVCKYTSLSCSSGYLTGYCPSSGNDVKCCVPGGGGIIQDKKCTDVNGKCQYTSNSCPGGYLTNYCPSSGANIKCCIPASPGGPSPCSVAKTRQGIVNAALWAHNSGKRAHYTQGSTRWSGINGHICPYNDIPPNMDCSSFVTWIYWSAFGKGPDYLNGENWSAGYTGTLKSHGTLVSLSTAQIGDLVFYENPSHVVILVSKNPAKVISFGSEGPVNYLNINFRTVTQIRTYPFF